MLSRMVHPAKVLAPQGVREFESRPLRHNLKTPTQIETAFSGPASRPEAGPSAFPLRSVVLRCSPLSPIGAGVPREVPRVPRHGALSRLSRP